MYSPALLPERHTHRPSSVYWYIALLLLRMEQERLFKCDLVIHTNFEIVYTKNLQKYKYNECHNDSSTMIIMQILVTTYIQPSLTIVQRG